MNTRKILGITALLIASGGANSSRAELLYGLSSNMLLSFDSATPGSVSSLALSGLGGENLIGLDLRPSNGMLYGLGSSLHIYTINTASGAATLLNPASFGTSFSASFGFDFNPVPDAIRVTGDDAQNFRVNANTGALISNDTPLAYAVNDPNFGQDPFVTAVAYGNNVPGATTTFLRGIDSSTDAVVAIPSPNAGTLNTIGLLGVNTTGQAAFDISGVSGTAYATLTRPGDSFSGLYTIDLGSGAASFVGNVGFGAALDGLTVAAVPEPGSLALLGLGAFALLARRKSLRTS